MKTLLIAKGLHPPWATGEASYTRGILGALGHVPGNEVTVVYSVDKHRIVNSTEPSWTPYDVKGVQIGGVERLEGDSPGTTKEKILNRLRDVSFRDFDVKHVSYQGLTPFAVARAGLHDESVVAKHIYGPAPSHKIAFQTKIAYAAGFRLTNARRVKVCFPSIRSAETYLMKASGHTAIVPPAIDTDTFCPSGGADFNSLLPRLESASQKSGLGGASGSSQIVLFMGWLRPERLPPDIVLKAFKAHLNRSPGSFLLIVGRQSEEFYGEARQANEISSLARRLGIEKSVGVALLELSQSEKLTLIRSSSLIIHPFTTSRLNPPVVDPPMAILEEMACGRPILATPVLGIPELVQDGVNGFIIDSLTVENMGRCITRAFESGSAVASKARETVVSKHSLEAIGKILSKLST
jgi:glycosyltransferase involved in cell wall biosynthesis